MDQSVLETRSLRFWLRLCLSILLFNIFGYLFYTILFQSNFNSIELEDFNYLPVGEVEFRDKFFVYFPEYNTLDILEDDEPNQHYLQATISAFELYSGFGFNLLDSVPYDSSLELTYRIKGVVPVLQVDIKDGSVPDINTDVGEIFSYFVIPPDEQWNTVSIPLHAFKRNEWQAPENPNDGVFDTNLIRSVQFGFQPDTKAEMDIRTIRFQWKSNDSLHLFILFLIGLLGILLFVRTSSREFLVHGTEYFYPTSVSVTGMYSILSISILLLFIFSAIQSYPMSIYFTYLAIILSLCIDSFHPNLFRQSSLFSLRYILILLFGCVSSETFLVIPGLLLYIMCYVPLIRYRNRMVLPSIFTPALILVGLWINPDLLGPIHYIYCVIVVMVISLFMALLHEILFHKFVQLKYDTLGILYEDLFQNSSDAIYTYDSNGVIENVNHGFEKTVGVSNNSIIGQNICQFIAEEDQDLVLKPKGSKPKQNGNYDLRFITVGQEIQTFSVNERVIQSGTGLFKIQAVARNITKRKQLEENLIKAKVYAEQTSLAKSQFLSNMSHEMRTPLNAILGFTEILMHSELDVEQHSRVKRVHQNGLQLLHLINDALDFSHLESDTLELKHTSFSPRTTLELVVESHKDQAENLGLSLTNEISNSIPSTVNGDSIRLKQIIRNLLSNALKFTAKGGVVLSAEPKNSSKEQVYIRFEVRDSGVGIAPEKLDQLFNPFTQVDESTTREFGGIGMGLATCKLLVNYMGGDIGVISTPHQGSTFWFEIPFKLEGN